ncbi:MAG: glycoside hydrolase family 32 protein [Sediminicola sp.]
MSGPVFKKNSAIKAAMYENFPNELMLYDVLVNKCGTLFVLLFLMAFVNVFSNEIQIKVNNHYLNIPIGRDARMKLLTVRIDGKVDREIPVQLAEDAVDYWIYIDISEYKGKSIGLHCKATDNWLSRIYQADQIENHEILYNETKRPQYHFSVKRGWSNDINGPIYHNNVYHLFYQNFPFGVSWNTGFMYWGHATSEDLVNWKEQPPAMRLDSLGSPWSGSAVIDKRNDAGFGKDAMVLFYTAFDRLSRKQVQCIAYSNDNGNSFQRYEGNPIIDSNREWQSVDTRDPKVFWHEPSKHWIMVLFEKDGMSFYNSTDMKDWKRQSHFEGLHECPDFFELPVDGDTNNKKWILHGGSSDYFIGSFDGKKFISESDRLSYAEGRGGMDLYAALTFENMPDNRKVQMAWGRDWNVDNNMPFSQMALFPTEFKLRTTEKGPRLMAEPIEEIKLLYKSTVKGFDMTTGQANELIKNIPSGPLHLKAGFTLEKGSEFRLRYNGNILINLERAEFSRGQNHIEILIDKTVSEIFINGGERYIVIKLPEDMDSSGLSFESEKYGPIFNELEVHEINSIWNNGITRLKK